jgi:2-polyprenyl-3-methyl-5-hydroxy-6-metoxy-1,4-benzoquinol methylase
MQFSKLLAEAPEYRITSSDCTILYRKLLSGDLWRRLGRLRVSKSGRTRAKWAQIKQPIRHWWQVPRITEHLNQRMTGDARLNFREWTVRTFFRDGKPRRAISLGCGSGGREIAWAKDGVFDSLLGVDLTPQCISAAQETARQEGVSDRVSFAVQDISGALRGDEKYDVILFEHSLHHFSDMPALLDRVAASLNPGGLLYIDEYVGPCRLQYTKKQLAFANAALQLIPEAFRVDYSGRWRKDKVLSSGPLMMYLSDPSEAIESDRILPELKKRFDVLVEKNVGGTIFPQVIQDIACNFLDDPIAINALSRILEMEADLIDHGWLESDYVCLVASPKTQNSAHAS